MATITFELKEDMVLISSKEWEKAKEALRKQEYLEKLDRGFEQLRSGKGVEHELIEI